jgi:hypothetical protein
VPHLAFDSPVRLEALRIAGRHEPKPLQIVSQADGIPDCSRPHRSLMPAPGLRTPVPKQTEVFGGSLLHKEGDAWIRSRSVAQTVFPAAVIDASHAA